jgi:GntR family transcriptional regulator
MSTEGWVSSSLAYLRPPERGAQDAWTTEAAQRGGRGSQRILHAGQVPAPAHAAELLDLEEGNPVVVRRRIIYLDEVATELTDTYYPADIASGTALAEPAKIRGGAVALLTELGHIGRYVREDVGARMPNDEERRLLDLDGDHPVLTLHRRTQGADDHPIQADCMVMPARRQRLRYEIPLV